MGRSACAKSAGRGAVANIDAVGRSLDNAPGSERHAVAQFAGTARARPMRMTKAAPPDPTRTTSAVKLRFCYGACVALSFTLCVKIVLTSSLLRDSLGITFAALGGWLAADFVGAVYHWNMDNYPSGPNGFLDHHQRPTALAQRSLWTNVRPAAPPIAALLAATVMLAEGPLAAFLLTFLNGILYTEHAHSLSHAPPDDLPRAVLSLQRVPILPILIPPAAHDRHHARPVGMAAYGGLNGWSNYLTDTTRFFRALEALRERVTGRVPLWRNG